MSENMKEIQECGSGHRCRRHDCNHCLRIRKAKYADRIEANASKTKGDLYLVTCRKQSESKEYHKAHLRAFIRRRRRNNKDSGAWKVEIGHILGVHHHVILQTEAKPTRAEIKKQCGRTMPDVKIQKIAFTEIRNVAAYLVKPTDPAEFGKRAKATSQNETKPDNDAIIKTPAGRFSGVFGSWHGNAADSCQEKKHRQKKTKPQNEK